MATANVAATAEGSSSAVKGIQAALDLFAGIVRTESGAPGVRRREDAAVSVDPRISYQLHEIGSPVDTTSSVEISEAVLIFACVPVERHEMRGCPIRSYACANCWLYRFLWSSGRSFWRPPRFSGLASNLSVITRGSFRLEIICGAFSDRGACECFLFPSAGESLGRLLQIS